MKKFFVISFLVSLLTPSLAAAACTKQSVIDELSRQGFTYEFIKTDDDDDNFFRIRKDGSSFVMQAEADGDLAFSKFFNNNLDVTNDKTSAVMETLRYLQIFVDSDNDVAMQYQVALWGEDRCNFEMTQQIKFFIQLVSNAEERLSE